MVRAAGRRVYLAALLGAAVAVACSGASQADGDSGARPAARSGDPAPTRVQAGCRVTLPNHRVPPYEERRPGSRNRYLRVGRMWTVVSSRGVVVARRFNVAPDGRIGMKWPWWRGVRGRLRITGRRLDAPAPALRADIPRGYGPVGFQATMLIFSSKGCWEVTGRVGDARLTFVTLVRVKRPRRQAGR